MARDAFVAGSAWYLLLGAVIVGAVIGMLSPCESLESLWELERFADRLHDQLPATLGINRRANEAAEPIGAK